MSATGRRWATSRIFCGGDAMPWPKGMHNPNPKKHMTGKPSSRRIDFTGRKIGNVTVLSDAGARRQPSGQVVRRWVCLCDCGKKFELNTAQLRVRFSTLSCGCLRIRATVARSTKHGMASRTIRPPEYICWKNMRRRCNDKRSADYKYYGARGIMVCARWDDFSAFFKDMGPKPSPSHSIDRIDVNGNYEPDNCRWATPLEQRHNRRDSRRSA
jgi:hypothetical protein